MSLLPLLFSAWWADLDRPHRIFDQNFGMGLYPDQLMYPRLLDRFSPAIQDRNAFDFYYGPFTDIIRRGSTGISTITSDKDTFKVILDVQQFKPEEVTVKLVDRFVIVEGKHEEKKDEHGFISRQFVRKYLLPEQVDAEKLSSSISSDGVLTITAPIKQTEEKPNERNIKIELTGKPAIPIDAQGSTTTKPLEAGSEEVTNEVPEGKPEK